MKLLSRPRDRTVGALPLAQRPAGQLPNGRRAGRWIPTRGADAGGPHRRLGGGWVSGLAASKRKGQQSPSGSPARACATVTHKVGDFACCNALSWYPSLHALFFPQCHGPSSNSARVGSIRFRRAGTRTHPGTLGVNHADMRTVPDGGDEPPGSSRGKVTPHRGLGTDWTWHATRCPTNGLRSRPPGHLDMRCIGSMHSVLGRQRRQSQRQSPN